MPPKAKQKTSLTFSTTNPCNEFLVQYLIRARSGGAYSKFKQRDYKDHKFFMYTAAMESIRKYPLPIICEDQLKILVGIGDFLTAELISVVRDHYRKFLSHGQPQHEEDEQNEESKTQNKFSIKIKNQEEIKRNKKFLEEERSRQISDPGSEKDQEEDNSRNLSIRWKQYSHSSSNAQSQSFLQEKKLKYKPRQGTQTANILKSMLQMNSQQNSITKKELQNHLNEKENGKIKQWKNCKQTLLKNDLIILDASKQEQSFFITEKGISVVRQMEGKATSNLSKLKMQEEIKVFKSKFKEKQEEEILSQIQSQSESCWRGGFCHEEEQAITQSVREKLIRKEEVKLVLLVDTREMKDQSEKSYFQEKLVEKYCIPIQTLALTIGDFAFMYEGKILNFIIERKKADDLASSIIDGRYKDQKYRLKNCGASNVIYLYEGHPSSTCMKNQKQLMNALNKTRIVDGFVVYKTKAIGETAKLLAAFHSDLAKKIQTNPEQILTIGTVQQFNKRNNRNRLLTIQKIFGLGLKTLPNVGKQTITILLKYFKSFKILYDKLRELENDEERVEFLNGLLKGGRTQAGVTQLIIRLLFQQ